MVEADSVETCEKYVDDVIEPDSTRPRIIAALEMLASKRDSRPAKSMESSCLIVKGDF